MKLFGPRITTYAPPQSIAGWTPGLGHPGYVGINQIQFMPADQGAHSAGPVTQVPEPTGELGFGSLGYATNPKHLDFPSPLSIFGAPRNSFGT